MKSTGNYSYSKVFALLVSLGGTVVMVGWLFDIEVLKSILPVWITMKFATALSFFFAGIILFFTDDILEKRPDISQVILSITSLAILLMMFTLLMSSIFGKQSGIEEMFIQESMIKGSENSVLSSAPGMPSIGTMVNFILISLVAILSLYYERKPVKIIRRIGGLVVILGVCALIGYLINVPQLYYLSPGFSSAMAVHTAIFFVFIGIGLILLKPVRR